jgi:Fe-Mn family superoxide dismutase
MSFELPALPYAKDALAPHISAETLEYHYGKHHQAYVTNLNNLIKGTAFEGKTWKRSCVLPMAAFLTTPLRSGTTPSTGTASRRTPAANRKANWRPLSLNPSAASLISKPNSPTQRQKLRRRLDLAGENADGSLAIVSTSNAGTPLTSDATPLLTVDVWEHAYYIDYRNARPNYLEHFWALVNWKFVAANLAA